MNLKNKFENMTPAEVKTLIKQTKKEYKNSNLWKVMTIVYVTNGLELSNLDISVKFYNGKYQAVYNKMDITFVELQKLINECTQEDIYQEAKEYIDAISNVVRDMEISKLQSRLEDGVESEEENKHRKNVRINKILNKVIIAIVIATIIYLILVILLNSFGFSFN